MNENHKHAVVVHGGAGTMHVETSQRALSTVKNAAELGFEMLNGGETALDCVTEAVALLEDSGVFNAGAGSPLTVDKQVEMEASIMDGKTLTAGAAGLLTDIRNPVRVARLVMEKTDHVFIVGQGAEHLANLYGLEKREMLTSSKMALYERQLQSLMAGKFELPKLAILIREHPEAFQLETVGAVALDTTSNIATATSTGGFPLKLPGRIGDSPCIGCGTYADNLSGGCSATGVGEIAIRLVLAKTVVTYMENGKSAQEAVEEAVRLASKRIANVYNEIGFVAIDMRGGIGAAHSSPNLCWAYMNADQKEPVASLTAKFVK